MRTMCAHLTYTHAVISNTKLLKQNYVAAIYIHAELHSSQRNGFLCVCGGDCGVYVCACLGVGERNRKIKTQ